MAAEVEEIAVQSGRIDISKEVATTEDGDLPEEPVRQKDSSTSSNSSKEEPAKSEEKSGIRKRIKINLPGLIQTDDSSHRPPPYKWAQQQLPACRPVYNGVHVFIVFTIIGIILLVLGSVFLALNLQLKEYTTTYTNCQSSFPNPNATDCNMIGTPSDFPTCADYVGNISRFGRNERNNQTLCPCYCQVPLIVEEDMSSPIYVYYQLSNYYQNHRRYVNSWSPQSLRASDITKSRSDCDPLANRDGKTLFPCGLIANSFFNDTLWLSGLTIDQSDIAWKSDRDVRFKNPTDPNNSSIIDIGDTALPPNWLNLIDEGQRNQSFMVWFRVAAFPTFRKLLGRIEENRVTAGNYTLNIVYNYPVTEFKGQKHFVISEVSWLGSRNLFLGIAYVVTGGVCIVGGLILLIIHFTVSKWKASSNKFLNRDY